MKKVKRFSSVLILFKLYLHKLLLKLKISTWFLKKKKRKQRIKSNEVKIDKISNGSCQRDYERKIVGKMYI